MNHDEKIFVAGHRGMVGSAIVRRLARDGYLNILTLTRTELELSNSDAVRDVLAAERPKYIFLAAAKVGGIHANAINPVSFITENLIIQTNLIMAAYEFGVTRLLFLGSSCIYPKACPQPIQEEYLLSSPLEDTNRAYAIAKIAGIEMCHAYNRQHGTRFIAAMPCNLYGPGDNYNLETSHVLPALIRKFDAARRTNADRVVVWGTGTPRREFLFSDDLADALVTVMNSPDDVLDEVVDRSKPPLINIGAGIDLTIAELSQTVAEVVGYGGQITFDPSRADGTRQKLLDVSRMKQFGWEPHVSLEAGIKLTYNDYLKLASQSGPRT